VLCFHIASTEGGRGSTGNAGMRKVKFIQLLVGAPEEIRTPDPQIRSLVLESDTTAPQPSQTTKIAKYQ